MAHPAPLPFLVAVQFENTRTRTRTRSVSTESIHCGRRTRTRSGSTQRPNALPRSYYFCWAASVPLSTFSVLLSAVLRGRWIWNHSSHSVTASTYYRRARCMTAAVNACVSGRTHSGIIGAQSILWSKTANQNTHVSKHIFQAVNMKHKGE